MDKCACMCEHTVCAHRDAVAYRWQKVVDFLELELETAVWVLRTEVHLLWEQQVLFELLNLSSLLWIIFRLQLSGNRAWGKNKSHTLYYLAIWQTILFGEKSMSVNNYNATWSWYTKHANEVHFFYKDRDICFPNTKKIYLIVWKWS